MADNTTPSEVYTTTYEAVLPEKKKLNLYDTKDLSDNQLTGNTEDRRSWHRMP